MTRRAALACLGSGAALGLFGSSGFNSLTAGRGVSVAVTDDPNALLGIKNLDGDETTDPVFVNQSNYTMEIEVSSNEDGVAFAEGSTSGCSGSQGQNPLTFSLNPGEERTVDVLADGTVTVDVSASLKQSGSEIGTVDLSRDVAAQSQAGQVQITPSYKAPGGSGKFKFGLENTGSIDVTLDKIQIRETTNPDAKKVGGKQNDDILVLSSNKTQLVNSIIEVGGGFEDVDPNVDLLTNEGEKEFEFLRFRDDQDKNVKMDGEEVGLTLEFADCSQKEIRVAPN